MRILTNGGGMHRCVSVILTLALITLATGYSWPQFNLDSQHSGNDNQETILTPANTVTLHRLFQVKLPDTADGAPIVLQAVHSISGTRDLIFVTTISGHLVALDALTGSEQWIFEAGDGVVRAPVVVNGIVYVGSLDGNVYAINGSSGTKLWNYRRQKLSGAFGTQYYYFKMLN